MSCSKVFVSKWSFNLCLAPRDLEGDERYAFTNGGNTHSNANSREHVVHEHIVDVVLPNQVADKDLVLFLLTYGPSSSRGRARQGFFSIFLCLGSFSLPPDLLCLHLNVVLDVRLDVVPTPGLRC